MDAGRAGEDAPWKSSLMVRASSEEGKSLWQCAEEFLNDTQMRKTRDCKKWLL